MCRRAMSRTALDHCVPEMHSDVHAVSESVDTNINKMLLYSVANAVLILVVKDRNLSILRGRAKVWGRNFE